MITQLIALAAAVRREGGLPSGAGPLLYLELPESTYRRLQKEAKEDRRYTASPEGQLFREYLDIHTQAGLVEVSYFREEETTSPTIQDGD